MGGQVSPGAQHRTNREVCNDIENDKLVESENKKIKQWKKQMPGERGPRKKVFLQAR
jgi:hypothetical protein